MTSDYPGEFEQMLMLVILELGEEAYGARVREALCRRTGREASAGALYTTLQRLELKGLLRGREGESAAARGGRPRRYFVVTDEGLALLRRSRQALMSLWAPVADTLDRT